MNTFRFSVIFFIFVVLMIFLGPDFISAETSTIESHPPTWEGFLIFGSYHNENVFFHVVRAARISLTIGFFALVLSIAISLLILISDFYLKIRFMEKIIKAITYFPRLLFLVFFAAFLRLHETSQLAMPTSYYLILILGMSGSFFLLAQTKPEIDTYRKSFFVHFAFSLPIPKYKIFFVHILRNCYTFPISIAKQMRDNIMFIAILPFTGVVHLQPEDLGGLIHKYFLQPDTFNQGWWVLFFPCIFIIGLILMFDLLVSIMHKK